MPRRNIESVPKPIDGALTRTVTVMLFVLTGLLLPPGIRAVDWPAEEGVMAHNFGWNREARPVLSMIFETEGPVRAAEDADLLFIHTSEDSASALPSPLGTWAALDHGGGLISIYSRLDETGALSVPERVDRGRLIARAGKSGMAGETGFYFTLFDRKERRWINPAMIIGPPEDTVPPQIVSVELKSGDGQIINPALTRTLRQGRYTVLVNAVDSLAGRQPAVLAPHRILCSVNGVETGALLFEAFFARDGTLMMYRNGLVPVKQIYAPSPAYEVAEFFLSRGQAAIEIVAEDLSGNARNAVFRLQVE